MNPTAMLILIVTAHAVFFWSAIRRWQLLRLGKFVNRFDRIPDGRHAADAAGSLLLASERAVQVALEAIQAMGGAGYLNEVSAGRLLRDAKLYTIGAGTAEIRRMLVGRELIGKLE